MYTMFLVGDCFGLALWVNNLFIFLKGTRCQPVFEPWPGDSLAVRFRCEDSQVAAWWNQAGTLGCNPLE